MYMKFEKMYSIHSGKPPNNLGQSEGTCGPWMHNQMAWGPKHLIILQPYTYHNKIIIIKL